jgi:hypothetical protein
MMQPSSFNTLLIVLCASNKSTPIEWDNSALQTCNQSTSKKTKERSGWSANLNSIRPKKVQEQKAFWKLYSIKNSQHRP